MQVQVGVGIGRHKVPVLIKHVQMLLTEGSRREVDSKAVHQKLYRLTIDGGHLREDPRVIVGAIEETVEERVDVEEVGP